MIINKKYKLINKIGEGSFGSIYKAENIRTREFVAIKIESIESTCSLLKNESNMYQYLLNTNGIPQVKWYGKDEQNYYMVINLLGKSLEEIKNEKQKFSLSLTLQIGIQLLNLIKNIHNKGLIHRDIKPENFLLGLNDKKKQFYLIDFGFCKSYINNDNHIESKKVNGLIGSLTYASLNAHNFIELSRRDDLESLGYMLLYFYSGTLPWREVKLDNDKIKQKKMEIIDNENVPKILHDYFLYVRSLTFKETPNYEMLINKFTYELDVINSIK
jgi:serine/threonine protein kinase